MDSRKPLTNISNSICYVRECVDETGLSSSDGVFSLKNEERPRPWESRLTLSEFETYKLNSSKWKQLDTDNSEYEHVNFYLRQLIEAKSSSEVHEGRSLNRTTDKFSWPQSVISKSSRRKPIQRRTTNGKQILYRAYEIPRNLIIPDGVTTWRHFI